MWVNDEFGVKGIGRGGLFLAGGSIGADLSGGIGTKEKALNLIVADAGEVPGDEVRVVEGALADMLADGGKGDDYCFGLEIWQGGI